MIYYAEMPKQFRQFQQFWHFGIFSHLPKHSFGSFAVSAWRNSLVSASNLSQYYLREFLIYVTLFFYYSNYIRINLLLLRNNGRMIEAVDRTAALLFLLLRYFTFNGILPTRANS